MSVESFREQIKESEQTIKKRYEKESKPKRTDTRIGREPFLYMSGKDIMCKENHKETPIFLISKDSNSSVDTIGIDFTCLPSQVSFSGGSQSINMMASIPSTVVTPAPTVFPKLNLGPMKAVVDSLKPIKDIIG